MIWKFLKLMISKMYYINHLLKNVWELIIGCLTLKCQNLVLLDAAAVDREVGTIKTSFDKIMSG